MPDSNPLDSHRIALVTGAGRRIGRAIALGLAADGWRVAVHYRSSAEAAREVCDECIRLAGAGIVIGADLACPDDLVRLVDDCARALGAPTLLVNNASEFRFDTISSLTPATWDLHQAVNVRAPVLLAQAMAAALPDGMRGNVVNLIDQRVWAPTPEFFSYTASKLALWNATRMLAQALAPRIRVNAVGPGPTLQGPHQTRGAFEAEVAATPLQRATSLDEIVAAVRFILDAPAMTGQMIALDSGQHLRWLHEATPSVLPAPVIRN